MIFTVTFLDRGYQILASPTCGCSFLLALNSIQTNECSDARTVARNRIIGVTPVATDVSTTRVLTHFVAHQCGRVIRIDPVRRAERLMEQARNEDYSVSYSPVVKLRE